MGEYGLHYETLYHIKGRIVRSIEQTCSPRAAVFSQMADGEALFAPKGMHPFSVADQAPEVFCRTANASQTSRAGSSVPIPRARRQGIVQLPASVVRTMVEIVEPQHGMSIYRPRAHP